MSMTSASARTDLDLDHFRELLEDERARLEDDLEKLKAQEESGGPSGETGELSNYDQHMADQATETFLREQDEAIHIGLENSLEQVNRAWARLERGNYGVCERCGTHIPEERLEFLPFAIHCLPCADEIAQRF